MKNHLLSFAIFTVCLLVSSRIPAAEFHISPRGSDENEGSLDRPFASFARAQTAARNAKGGKVVVHAGAYYLPATLIFTPDDNNTEYLSANDGPTIVSGGMALTLAWEPLERGIMQAKTPPDIRLDQVFFNGQRQTMARYPNFDPKIRPYGGFAGDAISKQRAARWTKPNLGFVHALHAAAWGGVHYQLIGKNENGDVKLEGGWQNNRGNGMHGKLRYVENIFEELDAPGEWFHNAETGTLYFFPPAGADLARGVVECPRLRHLFEFQGTQQKPVQNVVLRGLCFRHTQRTFMLTREPLLRSDWTIYRGGAILFNGAEDCAIADCQFDQMGGNAIFVNNYNRRIHIQGCDIHDSAASGVAFVGDPKAVRNPLFNYSQHQTFASIDKTPGPKTDNYPADCRVDDCLIRGIGLVEKQAAGVQISMASNITVRNCSIYDASRAGINIGDGCWGGHTIEFCDVFDTVQETGDHGSFNAWGRDRYWNLQGASPQDLPALALLDALKPTVLRNNRWRCDHGWDVDLDDGSSHYEIVNNVFLRGGLKLREGFSRHVTNNIAVGCSFHPHVWYHHNQQGISGDIVTQNIWAGAYAPAIMPSGKWGQQVDSNLFTTSENDRKKFAAQGCDANSLVGDPQFVNPADGNYQLSPQSPALKLGFKNFPTDQFGVRSKELRKLARTPRLPELKQSPVVAASPAAKPIEWEHSWQGAAIRDTGEQEHSAFGVPKNSGGVHLKRMPADSAAARDGFKTDDLIQSLNGAPVHRVADLWRLQNAAAGEPLSIGLVRAQASQNIKITRYLFTTTESADNEASFRRLAFSGAKSAAIRKIESRPETRNDPLTHLIDGKLASGFGPVFANGVERAAYRVELEKPTEIAAINTWSHHLDGIRGPQRFVLYGSNATADPGWNSSDVQQFTPLAEVEATSSEPKAFFGTSVRTSDGKPLGAFRWLLWQVAPVSTAGEFTAFQEFQILPPSAP